MFLINVSITEGLKDVIIYLQTEDKNKNRGFCFLEFNDHKMASQVFVQKLLNCIYNQIIKYNFFINHSVFSVNVLNKKVKILDN